MKSLLIVAALVFQTVSHLSFAEDSGIVAKVQVDDRAQLIALKIAVGSASSGLKSLADNTSKRYYHDFKIGVISKRELNNQNCPDVKVSGFANAVIVETALKLSPEALLNYETSDEQEKRFSEGFNELNSNIKTAKEQCDKVGIVYAVIMKASEGA